MALDMDSDSCDFGVKHLELCDDGNFIKPKSKVSIPKNPKLCVKREDAKMRPSDYMKKMSLTTEKLFSTINTMSLPQKIELLDMTEISLQKISTLSIDEPLFQPFPSGIVFQNCEPFKSYELPLQLRNRDSVPRHVKLVSNESSYFKIISPPQVGVKVGPGLPTVYKIVFIPDERKDYSHQLICITEREKFVIPIRAIGPRAILDFPDRISFPVSPVKHMTSKVLLIRNVGTTDAIFSCSIDSPFSIVPEFGCISVNESIQLSINYLSSSVGSHSSQLIVHYSTGEDVHVDVSGTSEDVMIKLNKSKLRLDGTFVSMSRDTVVTIHNQSNIISHFKWSPFATEQEEIKHKQSFLKDLQRMNEADVEELMNEEESSTENLIDSIPIMKRSIEHRNKLIEQEDILFKDDIISLDPLEGDIWPNSTTEVRVTFSPQLAGEVTRTIYCDVSGRQSRLPLQIKARGMGPVVKLSIDTLDIGNIFVFSKHQYEVVLANCGDIDAVYSLSSSSNSVQKCFEVNPSKGKLLPGGFQAIQILFSADFLGDINDEFCIKIDGAEEDIKLAIRGKVLTPTLHFDVTELNFGKISYGFEAKRTVMLLNTSLVPLNFHLSIPDDGDTPAIHCENLNSIEDILQNPVMTSVKEFQIAPSSGFLPAQSSIDIEILLCSNSRVKYDTVLQVDIEGIAQTLCFLPIYARCVIPHITALNGSVNLGHCFLNHSYDQIIELRNDTDLPALYYLPASSGKCVSYLSDKPVGVLTPRAVTSVSISLTVNSLGEIKADVEIKLFGSSDSSVMIEISATGEGPVLFVSPANLDWGTIPVLVEKQKSLYLTNESLIPAKFTTNFAKRNELMWSVSPEEGVINPDERVELTVTAYFSDSIGFGDWLEIQIENGLTQYVSLTGTGKGTTIVSDPQLPPVLNLGSCFTNTLVTRSFVLTNKGRRHQSFVWNTEGFSLRDINKTAAAIRKNSSTGKPIKDNKRKEEESCPVFCFSPARMELNPGESEVFTIEAYVDRAKQVSEKLQCNAVIGRTGGKEVIKRVEIVCDFIDPVVQFSSQHLTFTVDKKPEDELSSVISSFSMVNVSCLPTTATLTVEYPFYIVSEDRSQTFRSKVLHLDVEESHDVSILFDSRYKSDRNSSSITKELKVSYEEHPYCNSLTLEGVVNFPNLEFSSQEIDFGCILTDTESVKHLVISNPSPMAVSYKWSFVASKELKVSSRSEVSSETQGLKTDRNEDEILNNENEDELNSKIKSDESKEFNGEIIEYGDDEDEKKDIDKASPVPLLDLIDLEDLTAATELLETDRQKVLQTFRYTDIDLNSNLAALLNKSEVEHSKQNIEEIFDITPIYGKLGPGESEQINFNFYGRSPEMCVTKVLCEVIGGPTYEITLKGQSSAMNYHFDNLDINCGKIMYDNVHEEKITLYNTSHVGFDFQVLGVDPDQIHHLRPGVPAVTPVAVCSMIFNSFNPNYALEHRTHSGYVEAFKKIELNIKFLPTGPRKFKFNIQIQVAHFAPENINLIGEGIFPRLSLDLSRDPATIEHYQHFFKQAKETILKDLSVDHARNNSVDLEDAAQTDDKMIAVCQEVERLIVAEFFENQKMISSKPDILTIDNRLSSAKADTGADGKISAERPKLPEYTLDFGYVILGTVCTRMVKAENTGCVPTSFSVDKKSLKSANHMGFYIELPKVLALPEEEYVEFLIIFDPRAANLNQGKIDAVVTVNILDGPMLRIHLKAEVVIPAVTTSTEHIDFGEAKCGECRMISIQLRNDEPVTCEWIYAPEINANVSTKSKSDKYTPLHLKKRRRANKVKPPDFELDPVCGLLKPGEKQNIQIKFYPTEHKSYEDILVLVFEMSSLQLKLKCTGRGLEPFVEFSDNNVVFGPLLPQAPAEEKEVAIKNPCQFPIEVYCLELDKFYLEEEKVLRVLNGYDRFNRLLLPPRQPSDKLPYELIEYYDEQSRRDEEQEKRKQESLHSGDVFIPAPEEQQTQVNQGMLEEKIVSSVAAGNDVTNKRADDVTNKRGDDVVNALSDVDRASVREEMERNPVSAAIARYLGVDLSPEGQLARNQRGIALIIHGAPISGKTRTGELLAEYYGAALLSIDAIVLDALKADTSPAALQARELCSEAARAFRQQQDAHGGEAGSVRLSLETLTTSQGGGHLGGSSIISTAGHSSVSNAVNRRTSLASDRLAHRSERFSKAVINTAASVSGDTQMSRSRMLSISSSAAGEEGFMSVVLPEEILIDLISTRLQRPDCSRGVIFDGLESMFTSTIKSSTQILLKAINNRKYIYTIIHKLDYQTVKEAARQAEIKKEQEHQEQKQAELKKLSEMSEQEYEALNDEEKKRVDEKQLEIKRERLEKKKAAQLIKRQKEEQERQQAEARRLEEERSRRRGRPGLPKPSLRPGTKMENKVKLPEVKKSSDPADVLKQSSESSVITDSVTEERKKKKSIDEGGATDKVKHSRRTKENDKAVHSDNADAKGPSEEEILLMQRFKQFELSQKEVLILMNYWERSAGCLSNQAVIDGVEEESPVSKRGKRFEKQRPDYRKFEMLTGEEGNGEHDVCLTEAEKQQKRLSEGVGIPYLELDCSDMIVSNTYDRIVSWDKLPSPDEVLDGMGIGPKGPPIPPPIDFSVVQYPSERQAAACNAHYHILLPSAEESLAGEDRDKEVEESQALGDAGQARDGRFKKRRGGGNRQDGESKDRGRRSSATKSRMGARRGSTNPDMSVQCASSTPKQELRSHRWSIPAQGEVTIKISFSSDIAGLFDQTFNFEIMGTNRRYQLCCQGRAAFPTISKEPRLVYPERIKALKKNEIVHNKYVVSTDTYEFGPLLVGKSRDRHLEERYAENLTKFVLLNSSPLVSEMSFCFLNDSKEETFLVDPKTMTLQPNQQDVVRVWAYPKSSGVFEDSLVCCIKENPEPIQFKLKCYGVKPELELDKKILQFDKVLLHRKDSKSIVLKNPTLLPVAWRLTGLDALGEELTVNQDNGIVPPRSEFILNAYFRALKAINLSKKTIRLEISDVDGIAGLVQTENIQINAEGYDVLLDLSFPKAGLDGGMDFDTVHVSDEVRQLCTVKNKGKYDVSYEFKFVPTAECPQNICKMFSVTPNRGTLTPNERPAQIQIVFKATREVLLKDQPILACQVIEPNVASNGEVIASIPVNISARSVYTKYLITPENDINFGALLVNSRKMRSFTIENTGDKFDLKYAIVTPQQRLELAKASEHATTNRRVSKVHRRNDTIRSDEAGYDGRIKRNSTRLDGISTNQIRLSVGIFTVYPAFGSIPPGASQTINVDCVTETQGLYSEELSIDVIGRHPKDSPLGISYKLIAESCVPSIDTENVNSIFEEHRIFKSSATNWISRDIENGGIFCLDERRFIFATALVGSRSKARFKISNVKRVPCEVCFSVRSAVSKTVRAEVFEVSPQKSQIPPNSSVYVTVTFNPTAMQIFNAIFEAVLEAVSPSQPKGRSLQFDVQGEGTLPRVSIIRPNSRDKKGQPLILFKKSVIGSSQKKSVTVVNDGSLTCKVDIKLEDAGQSFYIKNANHLSDMTFMNSALVERDRDGTIASAVLNVGEMATFDVFYEPVRVGTGLAQLRCSVVDNQYEDTLIQLIGESYEELITIEVPHVAQTPRDVEAVSVTDENIRALSNNVLNFGDCPVNDSSSLTFSMTNHSNADNMKFTWPDHANLSFSPKVGHLLHGTTKEVTVTFKTTKPIVLKMTEIKCKVTKIMYEDVTTSEYMDWDDRLKIVKWVDVPSPSGTTPDSFRTSDGEVSYPRKRKVVEVEPEPTYREAVEFSQSLSVVVSVNADFVKYEVNSSSFAFKDTLMFQSRSYCFQMSNTGTVALNYSWQIILEDYRISPADTLTSRYSTPTSARYLVAESGDERKLNSVCSFDVQYQPFSIEPKSGVIAAGKASEFTVKFSPIDVEDYSARLVCSIKNLKRDEHGPVIGLRARSLMPYCHFEIEDSDYIRAARRNPSLPGPGGAPPGVNLDPNTRVIELHTVGVDNKVQKSFSIINPTTADFDFVWINEDGKSSRSHTGIKCLSQSGKLLSGKSAQITFEYTSSALSITESFWKFSIPQQNISVPFLLVGQAREPNVIFDKSYISFQTVMIGQESTATVTLINNEDSEYGFSFDEESCLVVGCKSKLTIEPMSGTVAPRSRVPLRLSFVAHSEKEININLLCNVKRKSIPLTLNVKAQGYRMHCTVMCVDKNGIKTELQSTKENFIDFGRVNIHESSVYSMSVSNQGRFPFSYSLAWNDEGAKAASDGTLRLDTLSSLLLEPGDSRTNVLSYSPKKSKPLRNCQLILQVEHGPAYTIQLRGESWSPKLDFSFMSHNFGTSFIYQAGMETQSVVLTIKNTESKEISLNCLYESSSWLQHNFKPQILAVGQSADIKFIFLPREAMKYHEAVIFEINGLSRQRVEFSGRGTTLNLEVGESKQKIVKFGVLKVGQTTKKTITIVNKSYVAVDCKVCVRPRALELQDAGVLTLSPQKLISLAARGGKINVEVAITPMRRIANFSEEIFVEFSGVCQTVFIISGSCQGMDISLDTSSIPFGAVVLNSSSSRQLIMRNDGDIGAKFKWEENRLLPNFSISPVEGYVAAGMDVNFTVAFHPITVANDVRCQNVKCTVEGMKPLLLTVSGSCISLPSPKDIYHCSTIVRQREVKGLQIVNDTAQTWNLNPVIDGEYWSGPETIQVPPQTTKIYELTYHPLTMTSEGKKHLGSVFFALPNGSGLMYNLSGTADPPKAIARISREVPCKVPYSELLSVHNWLKVPQRFLVKIEYSKQDKLDPSTTIKGLDYVYVPALSSKDFKLKFHSYKECQVQLTVTFKNESTGEYQFYEVSFKATRPGPSGSISLTVPVRQRRQHSINLTNPLNTVVTFNASCNVPDVLFPTQVVIPPMSEVTYTVEYFPLKTTKVQGKLEFNSTDLGLYTYDLDLKATPAGPERTIQFSTALGSSQTLIARFINHFKQKTDYTCKVDKPDFHVDKSIAAAPASTSGTEVTFEITYEPSAVGQSQAILSLTSPSGGEYIIPLRALCTPPKPQGPFTVRSGSSTNILFKNVFNQSTQFSFYIDSPSFRVKPSETIRANKECKISVGFEAPEGKAPVKARLVVTCDQPPSGVEKPQWVFYLRGVVVEGKE